MIVISQEWKITKQYSPGCKPNRVNRAVNKNNKNNADSKKVISGQDNTRSQKLHIEQFRVHQ